jgi:hypothetical protein
MPSDLFRQPLDGSVLSRLIARKATHTTAKNSKDAGDKGDHKRRLPAWAKVTKGDLELVMNRDGFQKRYSGTNLRPQEPSLQRISITRDAGRGYNINLALTITVDFEVFTYEQFERYAEAFLRRDPNVPIQLEWGNIETYNGRGKTNHTLGEMYVVSGGFTTTGMNTYKCTFRAIAPAEGIKNFDIYQALEIETDDKVNSQIAGETQRNKAQSLSQLVNTHFLKTGVTALTKGSFELVTVNGKTAGVLFDPPASLDPSNYSNTGKQTSPNHTNAPRILEYVTLEYIVDLLQEYVVGYYNELGPITYKLTFGDTEENERSKTAIADTSIKFKSCDPIKVLFLGEDCGNYTLTNGTGKNFEEGVNDSLKAVKIEGSSYIIDHKKILINKHTFLEKLLGPAADEIGSTQLTATKIADLSSNLLSDKRLPIRNFLQDLFNVIYNASGGFVNLSFQVDREYQDSVNSKVNEHKLKIYDASYVTGEQDGTVWEFDPLRGDGNVLDMEVKAELARDVLDMALWYSYETASGTANVEATELGTQQAQRQKKECDKAKSKLTDPYPEEGSWTMFIQQAFNTEHGSNVKNKLSKIRTCVSNAQALEPVQSQKVAGFMPSRMSVKMEGVFPVKIGNLVSSTNLPSYQKIKNGMALAVIAVTDIIEAPGRWTTDIDAFLSAASNLQSVE